MKGRTTLLDQKKNPNELSFRLLGSQVPARKYKVLTRKDLDTIPQLQALSPERREAMKAVSAVLPFRVNNYVVEDLIDWSDTPDDPIFQLTFPQPEMLETERFRT